MNADLTIELDALHDAIEQSIAAQFPDFALVASYRHNDRSGVALPACLIELLDLEPVLDEDPGTGQLALLARFEAKIIIGFRTPHAEREIRKLAVALAVHVYQQRWGLPASAAQIINVVPEEFEPDLDRYEVWRVEWEQTLCFGDSVWTNDGTIPGDVRVSFEPDTGEDHRDDYQPVNGEPVP